MRRVSNQWRDTDSRQAAAESVPCAQTKSGERRTDFGSAYIAATVPTIVPVKRDKTGPRERTLSPPIDRRKNRNQRDLDEEN